METNKTNKRVPIFGISRLRMGIDGPGITTLVTFMGCPLRCKYCINYRCHEPIFEADGVTTRKGIKLLTPQELYDRVKIDNIYFQATGGGICFGGGEPGLYADFIREFREICDPAWKITIETSLNFDSKIIDNLSLTIDNWIIDVKSLSTHVYKEYTGGSMRTMLSNLIRLKKNVGVERLTLKVPYIPSFETEYDTDAAVNHLHKLGYPNVHRIDYECNIYSYEMPTNMSKGKDKCEFLRNIRKQVAEKYGLKYEPKECHHEDDCLGVCPLCDAELRDLQRQLNQNGIDNIDVFERVAAEEKDEAHNRKINDEQQPEILAGIPAPPEEDDWWLNNLMRFPHQLQGEPELPQDDDDM